MLRKQWWMGLAGLAMISLAGWTLATASSSKGVNRETTSDSAKSCCVHSAAGVSCCDGPVYCPHTGQVYDSCCCDVVEGKWVCRESGTVSDSCCCLPAADAPQGE